MTTSREKSFARLEGAIDSRPDGGCGGMFDVPELQPHSGDLPEGWFRELKVGHDPTDPAEATLVLAAAAAANGLRCDGLLMEGKRFAKAPSFEEIARQLCQPISAVRRGIQHLLKVNAVHVRDGVHAHPEALKARWDNHRQRTCITTEARLLRMRPRPLLLTALVAGQMNERGHLRLGTKFLQERTGFAERTLERMLAVARSSGAIKTWTTPNNWQLFLSTRTSHNGGRSGLRSGGRSDDQCDVAAARDESAPNDHHEMAVAPLSNRRDTRAVVTARTSQNGGRNPDTSGSPDSPPDAPASPAGETRTPHLAANRASGGDRHAAPQPEQARQIVEAWVLDFISKGIEQLGAKNAPDVAGLIDHLGVDPRMVHDRAAFMRERRALAARVIEWCPSVERLGRWLIRVSRWFGVLNLPGYLRRACSHGDPGTVLISHAKNRLGRAAEQWRDFNPAGERSLVGPYAAQVEKLTAAGAMVMDTADEAAHDELRRLLRLYIEQERKAAARHVLLKLVGTDSNDLRLQHAVDGILTLSQARRLLGVA